MSRKSAPAKSRNPKRTRAPLPTTTFTDGFLTRQQAAAFAACNVQIIDSAIAREDLKAYRIQGRNVRGRAGKPRKVVINKLDLLQWVQAHPLHRSYAVHRQPN